MTDNNNKTIKLFLSDATFFSKISLIQNEDTTSEESKVGIVQFFFFDNTFSSPLIKKEEQCNEI